MPTSELLFICKTKIKAPHTPVRKGVKAPHARRRAYEGRLAALRGELTLKESLRGRTVNGTHRQGSGEVISQALLLHRDYTLFNGTACALLAICKNEWLIQLRV